jgi:hypothetical protein
LVVLELGAEVEGAELGVLDSPLEAVFVSDFESVLASVVDSALVSDFFSEVAKSAPVDPLFGA